jgi:DNA modification methylase
MKLRPKAKKRPWPAFKVERRAVNKLFPSAHNARLHSQADIVVIAKSIERFGFTNPALIDEDGNIIAGHGRVLAAKGSGIKYIPVIVARGWSEEEKRAYCIADNQIAARATWDDGLLATELQYLASGNFDLSLTGFDTEALSDMIASLGNTGLRDPEAAPEPPIRPVTRYGDCFRLGRHRVGCGDSTNAADVMRTSKGIRSVLMITDPPYGVEYDPSWRGKADKNRAGRSTGKVLNDDRADWRAAWILFPGDVAYVWHAAMFGDVVADGLRSCGFDLRAQIIWAKKQFALGRGDYHWQHEACWYVVRKGAKSHWNSDRKQSTLWEIANNGAVGNPDREKTWGHGTQKPVECMRRPIEHNSKPGDVIYDPFLGSGTTIIAAEMTGRACFGLELSPAYVDVIVQRWEEFTGEKAIHAATGQTFQEVGAERHDEKAGARDRRKGGRARVRKDTEDVAIAS